MTILTRARLSSFCLVPFLLLTCSGIIAASRCSCSLSLLRIRYTQTCTSIYFYDVNHICIIQVPQNAFLPSGCDRNALFLVKQYNFLWGNKFNDCLHDAGFEHVTVKRMFAVNKLVGRWNVWTIAFIHNFSISNEVGFKKKLWLYTLKRYSSGADMQSVFSRTNSYWCTVNSPKVALSLLGM